MVRTPQFNDEYHKTQREKMHASREKKLSQNQQDALNHLKSGGLIACAKNRVWYSPQSKYLLQKNTFDSLIEKGLIKLIKEVENVEYYGSRVEVEK